MAAVSKLTEQIQLTAFNPLISPTLGTCMCPLQHFSWACYDPLQPIPRAETWNALQPELAMRIFSTPVCGIARVRSKAPFEDRRTSTGEKRRRAAQIHLEYVWRRRRGLARVTRKQPLRQPLERSPPRAPLRVRQAVQIPLQLLDKKIGARHHVTATEQWRSNFSALVRTSAVWASVETYCRCLQVPVS